jgi:transcriptional regulator with XRE-family HTH domain
VKKKQLNQGQNAGLSLGEPETEKWLTSAPEFNQSLADRLRGLLRGQSVNAFAKKCRVPESSLRLYLDGGKPRPEALAKIALANHVSIDWLATGRGPQSYDELRQPRHEDFIKEMYLQDPAAAGGTSRYLAGQMPRLKEAHATLDELAAYLKVKVSADWSAVLAGLLADGQLTPNGARRILEELKRASA